MNLVFMGPPGAGKGTQSRRLAVELGVPHISTGEILRSWTRVDSDLGRLTGPLIDTGKYVTDEIAIGIVDGRLRSPDADSGFVLDGFPRTVPQAEALSAMLLKSGKKVDLVFLLNVSEDVIVDRVAGRRSCPVDGMVYHLTVNPSKVPGVCNLCGERLIQRDDDRPERVLERIRLYKNLTSPLIDYYKERQLLVSISGAKGQEGVWAEILREIQSACSWACKNTSGNASVKWLA